jgi:hypothetical protein
MSGRYRTVALQVVGVAVLAAFVYAAFLRPSDPGELSGIDAPGRGDGPTVVSPQDDDKDKSGKRTRGDHGRRNGEGHMNGAHSHGDGSGGGQPSGSVDAGDAAVPPDAGPGDDQYTDLVSILMKQVGEPGLVKEIDAP